MRRLDVLQEQNDTTLFVGPGNEIAQELVSKKNNFTSIRLFVFNPKLGGKGLYHLTLTDEKNEIVRQGELKEANAGWAETFRYDFKPIKDSENKTYRLLISPWDNKEVQDVRLLSLINDNQYKNSPPVFIDPQIEDPVKKSYISLAYSNSDNYKMGRAYLRGEVLSGDLVFQTFYQTSVLGFVKDSFADLVSRVKGDPAFFFFYFIFAGSLTLTILYRLFVADGFNRRKIGRPLGRENAKDNPDR